MEKLIYLLGDSAPGTPPGAREDLRDTLLGVGDRLLAASAGHVSFCVADIDDPLGTRVAQFNTMGLIDAVVSIWVDSLDTRSEIEAVLSGLTARHAGYLVTESIPLDYAERDWRDGERSPGVALVTTFPRPEALDPESFYTRWHGSHTPLSLEIHPLLHYVRNAVARPLTSGAPRLDAIVNESVASIEIAADPELFYSSEDGRKRAIRDLMSFVDFETMSTALMSEYILRT